MRPASVCQPAQAAVLMPCADPRRQWFVDGKWRSREPLSPNLYRCQEYGCGQCAPCRQSSANEWTTRLYQEAHMHVAIGSVCATLTYDPEHVPALGSLVRSHPQDFIRALRKRVAARAGPPLSFDCIAEYGGQFGRPHYHVCLFSYSPPERKFWSKSAAGGEQFECDELSRSWGKGRVLFQPWSVGAARYCAGHSAWKVNGDRGRASRIVYGPTGEAIGERLAEFHACSTRPGIGRRFYEKFGEQALRLGFTIVDSKKVPVPGYYLRRADVDRPELAELARDMRRRAAVEAVAKLDAEGIDGRLDAIEELAQVRIDRQARKSGF